MHSCPCTVLYIPTPQTLLDESIYMMQTLVYCIPYSVWQQQTSICQMTDIFIVMLKTVSYMCIRAY